MKTKEKRLIDVYLILAHNIRKYRLKKNLTQKELAIRSGYSYAYIRRLEAPKCIKNFSIQTIYNLSRCLDINIEKLFEEDDI